MMRSRPGSYFLALSGVAVVTLVTALWLPRLGLASAALLFLVPVLLVSARGGLGPGLTAALGSALAYNFFLLPPRFTLRIHGFDNVTSLLVLLAVAIVTSRLATALRTSESAAQARALASAELASFATLLGKGAADESLERAMHWLSGRFGPAELIEHHGEPERGPGFSTLDLSAAAWAMHNGDATGHGTPIMAAADWSFLPLSSRQGPSDLLAIARPAEGTTRPGAEVAQLQALAALLGQARDRLALETERQQRERLEDRDLLRRALLDSVAHDFRTPLTVVTCALEKRAADDPDAARALAEAQRLDRMLNDLTGAARMEGGALAPRFEAVDLIEAVADAEQALACTPEAPRLERHLPADLPLVTADPLLLRHLLINLLDNAARHAASCVTISARAGDKTVEISIADDGPGIPLEDRERIFERFRRIEGSDRSGGSGLGLAIVKGFSDVMGMTIEVDDMPHGGACFRLVMARREVLLP